MPLSIMNLEYSRKQYKDMRILGGNFDASGKRNFWYIFPLEEILGRGRWSGLQRSKWGRQVYGRRKRGRRV